MDTDKERFLSLCEQSRLLQQQAAALQEQTDFLRRQSTDLREENLFLRMQLALSHTRWAPRHKHYHLCQRKGECSWLREHRRIGQ